jgi:hypothetical protein
LTPAVNVGLWSALRIRGAEHKAAAESRNSRREATAKVVGESLTIELSARLPAAGAGFTNLYVMGGQSLAAAQGMIRNFCKSVDD